MIAARIQRNLLLAGIGAFAVYACSDHVDGASSTGVAAASQRVVDHSLPLEDRDLAAHELHRLVLRTVRSMSSSSGMPDRGGAKHVARLRRMLSHIEGSLSVRVAVSDRTVSPGELVEVTVTGLRPRSTAFVEFEAGPRGHARVSVTASETGRAKTALPVPGDWSDFKVFCGVAEPIDVAVLPGTGGR